MEQKTDNRDAKRQIAGVAGTIIFHGLLVLLLWFAMLKTPLPPWPDAGGGGGGLGIEVNLGNSDNGMGVSEANIAFPEFKEQAKDILTQMYNKYIEGFIGIFGVFILIGGNQRFF